MARASFLRFPQPKSFLWLMSLRTGTELIALTLLINKISGFYGILALFTGFDLSPLQLSMYVYSIGALILTLYLAPSIRQRNAFPCIALAWFYLIDSIINAAYTALFSVSWFAVLAAHNAGKENLGTGIPGGSTMESTSGFSNPEVQNVTQVNVASSAQPGVLPGQIVEVVAGSHGGPGSEAYNASLGSAVLESGSIASLSVICFLWALRVYFVFVVFAYARQVLRQHIRDISFTRQDFSLQNEGSHGLADNPYAPGREEGAGWRGKLGRLMISVAPTYWLGAEYSDTYATEKLIMKHRLETSNIQERERRRRSGTGPSQPSTELKEFH